jgi:exportin-2 (importin alpha re-exporter)
MLGIAIRLESHQGVSELNDNVNLMEFFSSQVFPELQDSNHANRPMVKATALKFVCTFRKQFTKEQLVALLPLLISHLNSPNVVVHTLAAYAIERILMTLEEGVGGAKRYKIARVDLQPYLETLFTGLFAIVDNVEMNENEHVMKCTMRALARAGEDVVPITGIVFNKLASALERVCKNPRNPSYNHYLFESIAALVRNVCSKDPSQTSQLETLLFPPFQTVLQLDILEFTPYVFQVLAQLLEYRPAEAGLGEAYKSLFPPLLTASLWDRKGNIPGLVRLLHAYLKKAAADLVTGGHLLSFLGIFQKLNAAKATEVSAFELLSAITMFVPQEALNSQMKVIFTIIVTKLQHGKSNRYPNLVIQYFALFVGLYGAQAFFDHMNQIQSGIALTLLVQVWIPKLKVASQNRLEAKTQVVGLTRLLCDTPALLGDDKGKKIWAQALAGVVDILTSQTFSAQDADDDVEADIEIGYDATYTQLSLASRKPHDPFASIVNPTDTFARSLLTLSTSQPGVLVPIIQQSLGGDPKLSTGFQSVLHKAGVNLL